MTKTPEQKNYKVVAVNRKARFNFYIESELECGIILCGTEVKSLREAQGNIAESYASVENSELWLINCSIAPYSRSGYSLHEERRKRKLLVSKRELGKLWSQTRREGKTLVPLVMYFNHKGQVKIKIGVAKGKKLVDKRQVQQKRDWNRQQNRLLKRG
ncbi:MAG: SsrA-binding protein SmpB [Rhodobacteraceae bacterium]|nr:SsrA-binding protein SmpB [Paracoccaceae bacterium]